METKYLISTKAKSWGWILFALGLVFGSATIFGDFEPEWLNVQVPDFFDNNLSLGEKNRDHWPVMISNNLLDEIALSMLLLGGLFLMLARRKEEDEFIMKIRLESILWAAIVNAILMLLAVWLIYDMSFFFVMVFAMFLFYLLFIIRFQWSLWKLKTLNDEE